MDNILRRQCLGHQDFLNITRLLLQISEKKNVVRDLSCRINKKLSKHLKLRCQIEGYPESLISISKVVEAYLVLISFFLYILQPAWSKPGWTLRRRLRLWIREETPESATSLSHWGGRWGEKACYAMCLLYLLKGSIWGCLQPGSGLHII